MKRCTVQPSANSCGSQRRRKCSSGWGRLRHVVRRDRKRLISRPIWSVSWRRQEFSHIPMMFLCAVLMMAETCLLAEHAICHPPLYDELRDLQPRPTQTAETVSIAAVAAASEQNASAILVLSTSGNTARLVSKYRPKVPILTGMFPPATERCVVHEACFSTVTRNEQTARQIHLHRGCYPFWYPEPRGIEQHQWQTDVRMLRSP
jgi:pyruvate kinase